MNWLGDLPNAGYSTTRERRLSDAMMFFLRDLDRGVPDADGQTHGEGRVLLLMMVIEGYDVFLARMRREWRAWGVTDDEIQQVWRYMRLLAGHNPQGQLAQLIAIRPYGSKLTPEQIRAIEQAAGQ